MEELQKRIERRFRVQNRRISNLEKGHAEMQQSLLDLKKASDANKAVSLEARDLARAAADNTNTILNVMEHAKGIGGFVAKHGPRIVAAGVGMAIYAGVIDGELGKIITALFA